MITLKDVRLSADQDARTIDRTFGPVGVIHLSAKEQDLFALLTIRDQYLPAGSFLIDDYDVLHPVGFQRSAFVLDINSAVLALTCVSLTELKNHRSFKKQLFTDLGALRDMPLATREDKLAKIRKILLTAQTDRLAYLLIDMRKAVNAEHKDLIEEALSEQDKALIIVLDQPVSLPETIVREEDVSVDAVIESASFDLDNVISIMEIDTAKGRLDTPLTRPHRKTKKKKEKVQGQYSSSFLKKIFRKNAFAISFSSVFSIALVFIMEMAVYYLKPDNTNLIPGVILLLVSLAGTGCDVYVGVITYEAFKKELTTKVEERTYFGTFLILAALGGVIGLALYFIFRQIGFIFSNDGPTWYLEPLAGAAIMIVGLTLKSFMRQFEALHVRLRKKVARKAK